MVDKEKILKRQLHMINNSFYGKSNINTFKYEELLLKDLCSRLPYGVKCEVSDKNICKIYTLTDIHKGGCGFEHNGAFYGFKSFIIKPYLRSISSMTEEEFVYFMGLRGKMLKSYEIQNMMKEAFNMPQSIEIGTTLGNYSNKIDWLNKYHFDYHGLIPKGLALEAPEGMYNLKK